MSAPHRRLPAIALCFSAFLLFAHFVALTSPILQAAPQSQDIKKKLLNRTLYWHPPQVDAPLRSRDSSEPCLLATALEQAGARADELATNLQNFTAQEKIQYRSIGAMAQILREREGTFGYTVVFEQRPEGLAIQESRAPEPASRSFSAGDLDIGLPTIALIFLSASQGDYEMKCEGVVEWNNRPIWVVHFQQRPDRPGRTASFAAKGVVYPGKLKGRAWIAGDSGQVVHLETSLMEPVPQANVSRWYLSIDYAPVQFRTKNVRVWLPEAVDAYCDFGDHRTIIYHTFTNFLLFSVQTDQTIDKPKTP